MTATTFDVRTFNRRTSDVATALLSALDVRELEMREAALVEREADVARREKAIDAIERIHELKGVGSAAAAIDAQALSLSLPAQHTTRHRFSEAFRIRERDWWTKVLGIVPAGQ